MALNERIPALRQPANASIDEIWAVLMMQLERRARIAAPQMVPLLDREKDSLTQIKEQLKDLVSEQFDSISVGASKAHRTITKSVQQKFDPAFARAKKEKSMCAIPLHIGDPANGSKQKRECTRDSNKSSLAMRIFGVPTCSRSRQKRLQPVCATS